MARLSELIIPSRRGYFIAALVILTVAIGAGLWWALDQLRPLPPRHIVMATGSEGSAYQVVGEEYRELLAGEGIDVDLRPTDGDVENLQLLSDPSSGVDAAFVQGGLTSKKKSPQLASLGTLFYQPLWIFYRSLGRPPSGFLKDFSSLRLSMGPPRSGTRALVETLLAGAGIDTDSALLMDFNPEVAAEQLERGRIDAAVILGSWDPPAVQKLLQADGISLMALRRVDAYAALYPYLERLVLPEGTGDLVLDNPPADVPLLAVKSSLVVRRDLHPAIQYLLLDAAEQIHGHPGVFDDAGQFPAAEAIDLPLSAEARQFYKSGRPLAQRYLPFWLAALVERLLVLLVPLLGVMYPLFRLAPAAYAWNIRRRIFGLYSELRVLELEVAGKPGGPLSPEAATRLESLEQRAHRLQLPVAYSPMLYTLRDHITLVRRR
ncbi:MAG: TAXI family TRAP transporter solute-binding subunit, partial [Gemmatimonadales bacterium]